MTAAQFIFFLGSVAGFALGSAAGFALGLAVARVIVGWRR